MSYIPQPDADVLAVSLPDEGTLLLQQETSQYYSLNETGSMIWQMMEGSLSDAEIVKELIARFDVTPEAASGALSAFMHDLKSQKLIMTPAARPGAASRTPSSQRGS